MNYPAELSAQLGDKAKPERPYNAHDYVLCYIAEHDGSSANDLLIYLWAVSGKVTTRNYLYHVIGRLRERKLITTHDTQVPSKARHFVTVKGLRETRPFVHIPLPQKEDDDE